MFVTPFRGSGISNIEIFCAVLALQFRNLFVAAHVYRECLEKKLREKHTVSLFIQKHRFN